MNFLKRILAVLLVALPLSGAQAAAIGGNFNAHGYSVINLHTNASALVDFNFLGGYNDAMFGLFDSTGQHLLSNDDANGSLKPQITRNLGVGNYSLLVTYCCGEYFALTGATSAATDGVNYGSYWFGGTASLASVTSYLDLTAPPQHADGARFEFRLTNAELGSVVTPNVVPEPGSIALFGSSIAVLSMLRRRKAKA